MKWECIAHVQSFWVILGALALPDLGCSARGDKSFRWCPAVLRWWHMLRSWGRGCFSIAVAAAAVVAVVAVLLQNCDCVPSHPSQGVTH